MRVLLASLVFLFLTSSVHAGPPEDAFRRAAEIGDLKRLQEGLTTGVGIDAADNDGWTALMFASAGGKVDAVRLLLRARANPNIRTKEGQTPLIGAVAAGNVQTVQELLKAGADVNARLPNGRSARDLAVSLGNDRIVASLGPAQGAPSKPVQTPAAAPASASASATQADVLPDAVIRDFLSDRGRRQAASDKVVQQAAAQQERARQVQAAEARKTEQCQAALSSCEESCRQQGTKTALLAFTRGLAAASKGRTDQGALNEIGDAEEREKQCLASCAAMSTCAP